MYKVKYTVRHTDKTHSKCGVLLDKSVTFETFKDAVKFMREFNQNRKPNVELVGKPTMELMG